MPGLDWIHNMCNDFKVALPAPETPEDDPVSSLIGSEGEALDGQGKQVEEWRLDAKDPEAEENEMNCINGWATLTPYLQRQILLIRQIVCQAVASDQGAWTYVSYSIAIFR